MPCSISICFRSLSQKFVHVEADETKILNVEWRLHIVRRRNIFHDAFDALTGLLATNDITGTIIRPYRPIQTRKKHAKFLHHPSLRKRLYPIRPLGVSILRLNQEGSSYDSDSWETVLGNLRCSSQHSVQPNKPLC